MSISLAKVVLLVFAVLMIVGSVTTWVTVSIFGRTLSVSGTNSGISTAIGVNGWITFGGGILLVVLGVLMMSPSQASPGGLAAIVAVVSLGFAVYYVVRVLQEISKTHTSLARLGPLGRAVAGNESIGYGLIILLVGAAGALVAVIAESRSN